MRRLRNIAIACLLLVVLSATGLWIYLRSDAFQIRMESFVAAQIRSGLGATVDIGSFRLSFQPLSVDLYDLVLHGRENSKQPPLARIHHVHAAIRIISFFHSQVELSELTVEQPQVEIYTLADGSTNLPQPPVPTGASAPPAQPLFDLGVRRLRVSQGGLHFQDRFVPLDLNLYDVALQLRRGGTIGSPNFDGTLHYRRGSLNWSGYTLPAHSSDVEFALGPGNVRIGQAVIQTADSRFEIHGSVNSLDHPQFTGDYTAKAAVATWAHMLGITSIDAGTVNSRGQVRFSPDDWAASGDFDGTGIRPAGTALPLHTWAATGNYTAGPAGLTVPRANLTGLDAHISLRAQYAHWRALSVDGDLTGFRVSALPPLLRAEQVDPRIVAMAGVVDGVVHGSFHMTSEPGLDNPAIGLDLDVAPVQSPGKIPLAGHLEAQLAPARSEANLHAVSFSLPESNLLADGHIDSRSADLTVSLTSTDLAGLRPLLVPLLQWQLPTRQLAEFAGAGQARARIQGDYSNPVVTGSFSLNNFRYGGFHSASLQSAFSLDASQLSFERASLRDGQQVIAAAGTVGLQRFQLTPDSTLRLQIQTTNLDISAWQRFADLNYPIGGVLNLRATIEGTRAHPSGSGQLQLHNGRYESQTAQLISADFAIDNGQFSTQDLVVDLARTHIQGQLQFGLQDHAYRVDVRSADLQIGEIAPLQSSRLTLQGTVQFHLSGSGSLRDPQANLTLTTSGLKGAGESLGDIRVQMQLAARTLHFDAADTLPNGSLQATGTAGIDGTYPLNAQVHLRDYDFDAFLRRFTPAELSGHSLVSGDVSVQGPLAQPAQITARASFDPLEMEISGLTIRNQGPIQLSADQREVVLQSAHLLAQDTDINTNGRAELKKDGAVQGQLNGRINLALLQSLQPNTHSSGEVTLAAQLGGTLEAPVVNGSLTIANGSLSEENLPLGFDNIQGRLQMNGTRVQIDRLTAQTGGGTLSVTGYGARTHGYSFDLSAIGKNMRARYEGISATGDMQLRLTGQKNNLSLTGDLQLNRIALNRDFDLAFFIANTKAAGVEENPNSLLKRFRLDVHLITGPQVELATNVSRMQLEGDLRLRGTLADPVLLGHATASEGKVLFAGNEYTVDRAQVQFVNPFRIEPVLDLGLTTTVQQYDVTLHISGPTDKLDISYRSDPPLSSTDIVALLATGQPTQASATLLNPQASSAFVGQSEQLLGQALDNLVAGRLQRLFGITQIQVNPNATNTSTTGNGSTVTIQQQVSRSLKLTYTQNLSGSSQDIVQVDWTISRYFGIMLNRDQFGLYGLSLQFRHRAR